MYRLGRCSTGCADSDAASALLLRADGRAVPSDSGCPVLCEFGMYLPFGESRHVVASGAARPSRGPDRYRPARARGVVTHSGGSVGRNARAR